MTTAHRPPAPDTTKRPAHNPWLIAVACGMGSYIDAGTIVSTASALVLYQRTMALSGWTIGVLSGALTLLFATGALVGGRIADVFGRRRTYLLSLVVLLAGQLVMSAAVAAWMLFVGVAAMGFAVGSVLPASLAIISDEVPEERRGRMIAFSNMFWLMGIVATTSLMTAFGSLGATCGRILFGHLAVVSALLLLAWFTVARNVGRAGTRTVGDATPATAGDARTGARSLARLRQGPALAALVTTGLFYALTNLTANSLGQFGGYLFVNAAGSTIVLFSTVCLATLPLTMAATGWAMRVADSPTRWRWFMVGAVLQLAGLVILTTVGATVPALVVMFVVFSLGAPIAGETMYKVWSQDLFAPELRATAQGTTMALARFAAAALAVITPSLLKASPRGFFGLLLALALIGMVIGWVWIRPLTMRAVSR